MVSNGAATLNGKGVVLGTAMLLIGENSRTVAQRVATSSTKLDGPCRTHGPSTTEPTWSKSRWAVRAPGLCSRVTDASRSSSGFPSTFAPTSRPSDRCRYRCRPWRIKPKSCPRRGATPRLCKSDTLLPALMSCSGARTVKGTNSLNPHPTESRQEVHSHSCSFAYLVGAFVRAACPRQRKGAERRSNGGRRWHRR